MERHRRNIIFLMNTAINDDAWFMFPNYIFMLSLREADGSETGSRRRQEGQHSLGQAALLPSIRASQADKNCTGTKWKNTTECDTQVFLDTLYLNLRNEQVRENSSDKSQHGNVNNPRGLERRRHWRSNEGHGACALCSRPLPERRENTDGCVTFYAKRLLLRSC